MRRILEENPTIQIVWELSPAQLKEAGSSARELLEWLAALGFAYTIVDDATGAVQKASVLEVLQSCPSDSYVNILCGRNG
jgi:hypothetical protein